MFNQPDAGNRDGVDQYLVLVLEQLANLSGLRAGRGRR